jgi:methyl-accepting chemotaxis protein
VSGGETAEHVSSKLCEITTSMAEAFRHVESFAKLVHQAASAQRQLSDVVAEMGQVTQLNAASAEESSSAAAELSGQSEELAAVVAQFQLDRGVGTAARMNSQQHAASRPAPTAPASMIPIVLNQHVPTED